jgi:hypothetical protein
METIKKPPMGPTVWNSYVPTGRPHRRFLHSSRRTNEDTLVLQFASVLPPSSEVAGELRGSDHVGHDIVRQAAFERLCHLLLSRPRSPLQLREGCCGVFEGRHVSVGGQAVSQSDVSVQVDHALVVGQVADPCTPSCDRLASDLWVFLCPVQLVILDERQVPFTLLKECRLRCVVRLLHHDCTCANLQLCVLVGTEAEEVVPLGSCDDHGVPHERLEKTVRQSLRCPQQILLVDVVRLVFDATSDVEHEVVEVVAPLFAPDGPLLLDELGRRGQAHGGPDGVESGFFPSGLSGLQLDALQRYTGVHATHGCSELFRLERVLDDSQQLLARRNRTRTSGVARQHPVRVKFRQDDARQNDDHRGQTNSTTADRVGQDETFKCHYASIRLRMYGYDPPSTTIRGTCLLFYTKPLYYMYNACRFTP